MPHSASAATADSHILEQAYSKTIRYMVPLVFSCYMLFALSRFNIGLAKLDMLTSLNMSEDVYGFAAGIFFIGYAACGIPSNLMLARTGVRRWICFIMLAWAVCSCALIFITTPAHFYTLRLLSGTIEAGFFPGVLLYFSRWFPAERRGRILSLFLLAIPLAGVAGSPLAGLILAVFADAPAGLQAWQWIFLFQSIPAVVCGFLILKFLKDSPQDVPWLDSREKELLHLAIQREEALKATYTPVGEKASPFAFLTSPTIWFFGLCYFCIEMGEFAVSFWMPTIIEGFGFENRALIGLLSAIPFVFAAIAMLLAGKSADRMQERRWHLIFPLLACISGLVLAATCGAYPVLAMCGLTLAAAGALTAVPMFWPLPTATVSAALAAGGLALINTIGNIAGFAGNALIGQIKESTQSTDAALYVVAGFVAIAALMVLKVPAARVNGPKHGQKP